MEQQPYADKLGKDFSISTTGPTALSVPAVCQPQECDPAHFVKLVRLTLRDSRAWVPPWLQVQHSNGPAARAQQRCAQQLSDCGGRATPPPPPAVNSDQKQENKAEKMERETDFT